MTAGHGLWFVLPVHRADFSMPMNLFHVATQSAVACSKPEYHGPCVA